MLLFTSDSCEVLYAIDDERVDSVRSEVVSRRSAAVQRQKRLRPYFSENKIFQGSGF